MPYHQIAAVSRHGRTDLVRKLIAELRRKRASGPRTAPDIREEAVRLTDRFMVTVVWDAWADVPETDRGAIILDAYEKYFGEERTRKMLAAMGVTRSEAGVLGIPANLGRDGDKAR